YVHFSPTVNHLHSDRGAALCFSYLVTQTQKTSKKMAEWRHASNGFVPGDAVEGGVDVNGEMLYVGRANDSGDMIPGKIVPSHGVLYVPYGGEEKAHTSTR